MQFKQPLFLKLSIILITLAMAVNGYTADHPSVEPILSHTFKPLIQKYNISGMAVGIIYQGQVYQYYEGTQAKTDLTPISDQTIFELGSVSKIFTATAGAYAQQLGRLSFADHPSKYWPDLKDTEIDQVNLLQLLTYTSGNLPLQLPEHIKTHQELFTYFKSFKIKYPVGEYRQYSNPSIGLFGHLTAQAMQIPFSTLLETIVFPKLQLKHTYIDIPDQEKKHYTMGYTDQNKPVRVNMDPLSKEAYGVKSTLPDLLKFIHFNLNLNTNHSVMKKALIDTQKPYFKLTQSNMYQALGWEVFAYPTHLNTLLNSNSKQIIFHTNQVTTNFQPPISKVFHKTGSTNGFSTYLIFIPEKDFGLVMLMNKRIPNEERIQSAYQVIQDLHLEH